MIKDPTIKDFHIKQYITWKELEEVFGKREYKKFLKWMRGQGTYVEGVFPYDLKRYLNKK